MNTRQLLIASVSAVLLAAYAAAPAASAATSPSAPGSNGAVSPLLLQALEHQRNGAYESAINAYTEALKAELSTKMRVTAIYNRALAHQQAGHQERAVEDFSSALLLNPKLAHAYYGRGERNA